jgi:hypothetical protein
MRFQTSARLSRYVAITATLLTLASNLAAYSSLPESRSNDLTGYYFIAGKAPKGFENISELALDDHRGSKANGTLNGFIHTEQRSSTNYCVRCKAATPLALRRSACATSAINLQDAF